MKRTAILIGLLAVATPTQAGLFGPSNYWECVLEKIEGVASKAVAYGIANTCEDDFPTKDAEEKDPWMGVQTRSECLVEYGQGVSGEAPTMLLRSACARLYPNQ